MIELYPGQEYVHRHNQNVKRAEENWMAKQTTEGAGGALREALERLDVRPCAMNPCDHVPKHTWEPILAAVRAAALSLSSPIEPPPTHELLVGGIVRAALELAILRGDLRMDSGDAFEEMSESEREDVITDTWNAMNGEGTCDDEPVKELTAIYAAMARPIPQASSEIREALDVGKLAVRLAFYIWEISPVGSIGRVELASYIRKEIESALAPSRQGAGNS